MYTTPQVDGLVMLISIYLLCVCDFEYNSKAEIINCVPSLKKKKDNMDLLRRLERNLIYPLEALLTVI